MTRSAVRLLLVAASLLTGTAAGFACSLAIAGTGFFPKTGTIGLTVTLAALALGFAIASDRFAPAGRAKPQRNADEGSNEHLKRELEQQVEALDRQNADLRARVLGTMGQTTQAGEPRRTQ